MERNPLLTLKHLPSYSINIATYPLLPRIPIMDHHRIPISSSIYSPIESPWQYVLNNYYKLACFYAHRYAEIIKDPDSFHDFKTDMLLEMVQAYIKYKQEKDKPLREVDKILKTIPVYYYQLKVMRKPNIVEKVDITDTMIIVNDLERFVAVYDRYHQRFLMDYYKLGKCNITDEEKVLYEILYPSDEFQNFIKQNGKGKLTKYLLMDYFKYKDSWSNSHFEFILNNLKKSVA